MVAALPRHSVNVRPHLDEIDALLANWPGPTRPSSRHLSAVIAPSDAARAFLGAGRAAVSRSV